MFFFIPAPYLVGGPNSKAGTVYVKNFVTGITGPVCDDGFDAVDVSSKFFVQYFSI